MSQHSTRRGFLIELTRGLAVSTVVWRASASGASLQRKTASGDLLETVPHRELPSFAKAGGPAVEAVYRYAVEHEETLQYIPCVCGCGAIGHRHNAHCYVAERHADGVITFTDHGAR
jgi:hypothetical protein